MLHSTPTQYAIRGLCELASRGGSNVVMVEQIAAATQVPAEYLAKIFSQLAKAGVLSSAKGRGGGFALARPAPQIFLADVAAAIEGKVWDRCVLGIDECSDAAPCAEHDLFKPIRQRLNDYLTTTSLADLLASVRAHRK